VQHAPAVFAPENAGRQRSTAGATKRPKRVAVLVTGTRLRRVRSSVAALGCVPANVGQARDAAVAQKASRPRPVTKMASGSHPVLHVRIYVRTAAVPVHACPARKCVGPTTPRSCVALWVRGSPNQLAHPFAAARANVLGNANPAQWTAPSTARGPATTRGSGEPIALVPIALAGWVHALVSAQLERSCVVERRCARAVSLGTSSIQRARWRVVVRDASIVRRTTIAKRPTRSVKATGASRSPAARLAGSLRRTRYAARRAVVLATAAVIAVIPDQGVGRRAVIRPS
jgi:hypothetical protein